MELVLTKSALVLMCSQGALQWVGQVSECVCVCVCVCVKRDDYIFCRTSRSASISEISSGYFDSSTWLLHLVRLCCRG